MPLSRIVFSRISHVSFSVRDLATSVGWYKDVLGLLEIDYVEGDGWQGVLLLHEASGTMLECQHHDANQGEPFDPRRTGFDHVAFKVDSRELLDDWQEQFFRLDIDYTPVVDRDYGSVLTFRDPDGIQLEMFYREEHP